MSSEEGTYFYNPDSKETSWELPYHPSIVELQTNFQYVWENDASGKEAHDAEVRHTTTYNLHTASN